MSLSRKVDSPSRYSLNITAERNIAENYKVDGKPVGECLRTHRWTDNPKTYAFDSIIAQVAAWRSG